MGGAGGGGGGGGGIPEKKTSLLLGFRLVRNTTRILISTRHFVNNSISQLE